MTNSATPKSPTPHEKAKMFLARSHDFRLGILPTESPHPLTHNLSDLAKNNLPEAITILRDVELTALQLIKPKHHLIEEMSDRIDATLSAGNRVFFCGCGATGRLSLTIETLWHEALSKQSSETVFKPEQVVSFMAGGDFALVRSIENFEDFPEYGARQLTDLGFGPDDLLIATTEGGETPFVIGATEAAAQISSRSPYFLYCNPDDLLKKHVPRSQRVIENPKINKINLTVGPMALCGSTRLQATTVLTLAAGSALLQSLTSTSTLEIIAEFEQTLLATPLEKLADFIKLEAALYQAGDFLVHNSEAYAITVLTDLTERSPTFSLQPFENHVYRDTTMAWTYFFDPLCESAQESWRKILRRAPRALDWDGFREKFGLGALYGFDFSKSTITYREKHIEDRVLSHFRIARLESQRLLAFSLGGLHAEFSLPKSLLVEHLLVKIMMNISSTLVMGRMGRFEGNLMLWVKASNMKLIDRSIRFVQILVKKHGLESLTYEDVAFCLFETLETLPANEPIVMKTAENLISQHSEVARKKKAQ